MTAEEWSSARMLASRIESLDLYSDMDVAQIEAIRKVPGPAIVNIAASSPSTSLMLPSSHAIL